VSPDRKHSNDFVQHCNEMLIERWKKKLQENGGSALTAVHIW
jgi:hypothetical protein